jgi:hypothetical protein
LLSSIANLSALERGGFKRSRFGSRNAQSGKSLQFFSPCLRNISILLHAEWRRVGAHGED